jgi:hypothetical protein
MISSRREYNKRYYQENRDKILEKQRQRRANNPEKTREQTRRSERKRKLKKYGLNELQYYNLLDDQLNRCAICLEKNFYSRDWHIDHCHKTGIVRGLLCHTCNLMLGNAKDDVGILQRAINYLRRFEDV